MTSAVETLSLPRYWFQESAQISQRFYGAFEGGGAKGVAYAGALLAMKEQALWFRGVCGASAGAITAALVAAGLDPEDLDDLIQVGLNTIKTGVFSGLRRLHSTTGYFTSNDLRDWIEGVLKAQVGRDSDGPPVTFRDLYEASGIELNVVAADLSRRRQVVFSTWETPTCSVADAVAASSAIPVAFASHTLEVPDEDGSVWHHTIVDGGIWSNLPSFVFEDSEFREAYKREPRQIPAQEIILFLLKETDEEDPPRGEGIHFVATGSVSLSAREWKEAAKPEVTQKGLPPRIAAIVTWPIGALGRLVGWNGGMERGRWPLPPAGPARNLLYGVDGLFGGIYPIFFGLAACAVSVLGAIGLVTFFVEDQRGAIDATDWTNVEDVLGRVFVLALVAMLCAVAVLMVFVTTIGVLLNFLLLRTFRRVGYGLMTTYAAGPGAPDWISRRHNVISLPIPPEVTTLSFEMPQEDKRRLLDDAHDETTRRLREIQAGLPRAEA